MTAQQLLYLSRADVESVALDMATIINLLEAAFKEKGRGQVEIPPKPGIHTQPDAFIHAASLFCLDSAGLKWVILSDNNSALPTSPVAHLNDVGDRHTVCRHGLHVDYGLPPGPLRAVGQVPGAA
jgi:ornithine cyclodeaminase/alanine dehydrogenase-like protein (mu-crystallin family)